MSYLLKLDPGDSVNVQAVLGEINSKDPYVTRTDIVVPSKGHAGIIQLIVSGKDGKRFINSDSSATIGSFNLDLNRSTIKKNYWYWEWKITNPELKVEYTSKLNTVDTIQINLENESSVGNNIPVNIQVTLSVDVIKSDYKTKSTICYLPQLLIRFFRLHCSDSIVNNLSPETNEIINISSDKIPENAKLLASILSKPDYHKLLQSGEANPEFYKNSFNKFIYDPYDSNIPEKAREVYKWSRNWDPENYPENYIECVAFVHMVYNMSGIRLPKGLSHPINWPKRTDIFEIYESSISKELPQSGDIVIWKAHKGNPYGHVGVIVEIDNRRQSLRVANSNSNEKFHSYKFTLDNHSLKILDVDGGQNKWRPVYWLRLK